MDTLARARPMGPRGAGKARSCPEIDCPLSIAFIAGCAKTGLLF
jgi:hypothetical protein